MPTGWIEQGHGRLTGAMEERLTKVKIMDKAFNLLHGAGAQLNDDKMKTTVEKIKTMCPAISIKVIDFFTKMKYHERVKSINENNSIKQVAKRKDKLWIKMNGPRSCMITQEMTTL